MFKWIVVLCVGLLIGCQSTQEKNQGLVRTDYERLKPLSSWRPTWCRVDTRLTQPALARYREMFPAEEAKLSEDTWGYTWKAREESCEVTTLDNSEISKNHRSFLETAFCLLLQTHFVNSPFDELKIMPEDVVSVEGSDRVQVRTGPDQALGLYLDRKNMTIETHTKSRGVLKAQYTEQMHQWLPSRLEQRFVKQDLAIDDIQYDSTPVGGRTMIKSFWISVGDEQTYRHTQVTLSNCQNF